MPRIKILLPHEVQQFDSAPTFNNLEREYYFSFGSSVKEKIDKAIGNTNKIGLVVQYGYFRATGKFFVSKKYKKSDMNFIASMLKIKNYGKLSKYYKDGIKLYHKNFILELFEHKSYQQSKVVFSELLDGFVAKQMHPKNMLFSTVDVLRSKKIEVPGYSCFAESITAKLNTFENDLVEKINSLMTESQMQALDSLIETNDQPYTRPMLTKLKIISQSVRPVQIKQSVHAFLIIKKLFFELHEVIDKLGLSPEAIRYYGEWTTKAKVTQITEGIADADKRYLYLLGFIVHQYKTRQDIFFDIILKSVQHQLNGVKALVEQKSSDELPEQNELTLKILDGVALHKSDIKKARRILYDDTIPSDQKVLLLQDIIPKKNSKTEESLDELYQKLKNKLDSDKDKLPFYNALHSISRKLQNRVADIVKYLKLDINANYSELHDALAYYQSHNSITKTAPDNFLDDSEYKPVYENGIFNASLYKAIFFIKTAEGIRSGTICLSESYRYMPIESYLIDKNVWEEDKDAILAKTDLSEFKDIDSHLLMLKNKLDRSFYHTNKNIKSKSNKYTRIKKDGKLIIYTPGLEKPDYDSVLDLIGKETYVPILQMVSEVDNLMHFTSDFKHYKLKGAHGKPSEEVFYAGLFSLGTNISLHKLANTSIGIKYNTLSNAVNWYFSLENLQTVNDSLTNFMNGLWLPTQFKKEIEFLHTSSDAQKRSVSAESLNANFSYKYFGHGKGSNIYTFIDERGILFYSTVFSSSERDAAYVIDGLLHNPGIKSDMHSTDTEGYSETIFAISHLINTSFAPRIKDVASVSLVSFDNIKADLEKKEYPVIPNNYVNATLIRNNWDTILRLMATIKLREHKASTILKRLNSYDKQHPLQKAIKEFGRIIKSTFILNYIDDVELRQTIEKQLNKGELANKFSSAISFANNQEIIQVDKTEQEVAAMCKTVLQNIIILWNYIELTKIIMRSDSETQKDILSNVLQASILVWRHVNLLGTYDFSNLKQKYNETVMIDEIIKFKAA